MKHVLWIGGAPAAGKTTIAKTLARRHGTRLYSADTQTWVHRDRALSRGSEPAQRWESLTEAERWERSTPQEMLEMSLHHERGAMVIDDLRALPDSPLIIAEGSTLPAWAVATGAAEYSRALWLLPTAEFQERQLAASGATGKADLYRFLREVIEREAQHRGVATLTVDGGYDVAAMVDAVERFFAAAFAEGPCARSRPERQRLLREMNEAVIKQVRGYYARPWAVGNPDAVARSFVCECGDPECVGDVRLTVSEASAGPVISPGHDQETGLV